MNAIGRCAAPTAAAASSIPAPQVCVDADAFRELHITAAYRHVAERRRGHRIRGERKWRRGLLQSRDYEVPAASVALTACINPAAPATIGARSSCPR